MRLTTSYGWLVDDTPEGTTVDIFVDWNPAADGSPYLPLAFSEDGVHLLIFSTEPTDNGEGSQALKMDEGLAHNIRSASGVSLITCGASGALSKRLLERAELPDGVTLALSGQA